jgi:hypothetical protein
VVPKQEIATRFARPSDVCGVYVPLWLRAFASISSSARSIGLGFAGEMVGSCLLVGAVISFGRTASAVRAMQSRRAVGWASRR